MSIFNQIFGNGFDSTTVEPQQEFDVLPPGKYAVLLEKAEVKATKRGDGHYLEVCGSIIEGPAKNRKLWSRMNIDNPSEVAQRIGQSQLSGLCKACGIAVIQDEAELVGKTCVASVKVKNEQNEVRAWLPYEYQGESPPTAGTTQTAPQDQQSSTPTTANKPPWQR